MSTKYRLPVTFGNKMLSYRRETVLQGALVLAQSGRLKLEDNILIIIIIITAFV